MISNLIDSMKLRDGEIELNQSTFNLQSVVDGVLIKSENSLDGIKVIKSYKNDIEIFSDEARFKQILNSLLSNAVKYCDSTIAVVVKANKNDFVLEILDDGEGFADVSKALQLFGQSDEDNMTRTAQGTGVGLYIVKKLCDIMRYKVNIDKSNNLGGARVVISGKIKGE